ncbi:MAG: glycosyltransferase [Salibacteraceae bacterium]
MRVLHITSPKSWRGGEQQLMYLVEELNKVGVWQIVLCPFNSEVHAYCLKNHINHLTYYKGFSANPMVAFRVNHVCKRERIDLMHVHDSHAHNFAVLSSVLSNNDIPIVVSRRVDFPVGEKLVSAYKYNHPRIAKIICVSRAILDIMEPAIEDKTKLAVVHSGVDLEKFEGVNPADLHSEYDIPQDHVVIGNVAALAPHKDYPTFIHTARRLIESGLKAKFLAIGDGPSRKEIIAEIARQNMQNHIVLTGFRSDVKSVLLALDAFLITSETEGLGTSILDAQAAGIPIVATRAGGITEVVIHEKTGLLADVKDDKALAKHVLSILENKTLRDRVVSGARDHVKAFSKQETAKKTKQVYDLVLLGNPAKA